MTPDGRYVAFSSADGLLVSGTPIDTNNAADVYVYDRLAMTLSRVDMSTAQVSAGGERPGHDQCRWPLRRDAVGVHRRLARASLRDRPELGDPVDADWKRVSTAPSGAPPQLASTAPQISRRWNPRPLLVGGDELSRHRAAGRAASLYCRVLPPDQSSEPRAPARQRLRDLHGDGAPARVLAPDVGSGVLGGAVRRARYGASARAASPCRCRRRTRPRLAGRQAHSKVGFVSDRDAHAERGADPAIALAQQRQHVRLHRGPLERDRLRAVDDRLLRHHPDSRNTVPRRGQHQPVRACHRAWPGRSTSASWRPMAAR